MKKWQYDFNYKTACYVGCAFQLANDRIKWLCRGRSSRLDVFLEISTSNFIKIETLAQVLSCEFLQIFKNTFSYRTPLVAASVEAFWKAKEEYKIWSILTLS